MGELGRMSAVNDVVELGVSADGVVVVQMQDRKHRNTFSYALIEGLMKAFEQIKEMEQARVVVIYGYDTYFCCGGTKDELLDIFDGKATFADLGFYRLLIDCELPTIAAMQGHALGGGLAFGALADIMLLATESIYSANFMKYGFTPGMGSTYSLPKKFGEVLGTEMLMSARTYHGGQLAERGVSARVVRRSDVLSAAMGLAKDMAANSPVALRLLKRRLAEKPRAELSEAVKAELSMHEVSFAQPEVRERIERLFGA